MTGRLAGFAPLPLLPLGTVPRLSSLGRFCCCGTERYDGGFGDPLMSADTTFCGGRVTWACLAARGTGVFTRRSSHGVTRPGILAVAGLLGALSSPFGGTGGGRGSSQRHGRTASARSRVPALGVTYRSLSHYPAMLRLETSAPPPFRGHDVKTHPSWIP